MTNRVDVAQIDELLDIDRPRLAGLDRAQLEVGDDHLPRVFELVAAGDLLVRHLDVLLRAPALDLDQGPVLHVHLVEVEIEVLDRGRDAHRNVHQPETERAAPQRSGHDQRLPEARLASSAAVRSPVSAGSSTSGSLGSSPTSLGLDERQHALAAAVGEGGGIEALAEVVHELRGDLELALDRRPRGVALGRRPRGVALGRAREGSRSVGAGEASGRSRSRASTSSSAKRIVCSARTVSRGRTATRYSRP